MKQDYAAKMVQLFGLKENVGLSTELLHKNAENILAEFETLVEERAFKKFKARLEKLNAKLIEEL